MTYQVCHNCGGSAAVTVYTVPREPGCFNFAAHFSSLDAAKAYDPDFTPVVSQTKCIICNGTGVIDFHVPCRVCNDTKTYKAIIEDKVVMRDCEICT